VSAAAVVVAVVPAVVVPAVVVAVVAGILFDYLRTPPNMTYNSNCRDCKCLLRSFWWSRTFRRMGMKLCCCCYVVELLFVRCCYCCSIHGFSRFGQHHHRHHRHHHHPLVEWADVNHSVGEHSLPYLLMRGMVMTMMMTLYVFFENMQLRRSRT